MKGKLNVKIWIKKLQLKKKVEKKNQKESKEEEHPQKIKII